MAQDRSEHFGDRIEPVVSRWYPIGMGQGECQVMRLRLDATGRWTHVLLEYCSGCEPVPPRDRPNAPVSEWELPFARIWYSREQWNDHWRNVSMIDLLKLESRSE